MAINPETQYAGKIAPSDAEYPYGKARNITVPGDGTGTPWEAALVNDLFGFQQALLDEAEIVPSGNPDHVGESQYLQALRRLFANSADSVAEIEGLSLPVGSTIFLNAAGQSGVFDIVAGDFSTELAEDTYNALFIGLADDPTATTKVAKRRFSRPARFEWWGIILNDDTTDYKARVDAATAIYDDFELGGDIYLSNFDIPNNGRSLRFVSDGESIRYFRSFDGAGDPDYFAAPLDWLNNTSSVGFPLRTRNVGFDGGTKAIGLVVHAFFCNFDALHGRGGTSVCVKQTALNRDGSTVSSTMVNNRYHNIWIQSDADTGFLVDEDGKGTDYHIEGGYIFSSTVVNLDCRVLAGANITGVHCYGAPLSARFKKWSGGTRVHSNYFEKNVEFNEALGTKVFDFGPNNHVLGDLTFNSGNGTGGLRLHNNKLNKIVHAYFGSRKIFSESNEFQNSDPYSFTNNNTGNTASIEVLGDILQEVRKDGVLSPADSRISAGSLIEFEPFALDSIAPTRKRETLDGTQTDTVFTFEVGTDGGAGGKLEVEVFATEIWNGYSNQSAYAGKLIFNYARKFESAANYASVDVVYETGNTANLNIGASTISSVGGTGVHTVTCTVSLTHPTPNGTNYVYTDAVLNGRNVSNLS